MKNKTFWDKALPNGDYTARIFSQRQDNGEVWLALEESITKLSQEFSISRGEALKKYYLGEWKVEEPCKHEHTSHMLFKNDIRDESFEEGERCLTCGEWV